MKKRRLGRIGFMSSVVVYGAASLSKVSQEVAEESIFYALDNGVNHIDTARDYGDSELKLGKIMPEIRDKIFLATKTLGRTKEDALNEINDSLSRLQTDHIDLIQLHAVNDFNELDKITIKGGAIEGVLEAKKAGLVSAIGITGHGHDAPAVHLEALNRFSFDSVLTPLNYHLYQMGSYRQSFDALYQKIKQEDVALRVIKTIAKGLWKDKQVRSYTTWYEPFDEQKVINACVKFALSFEGVAGIATAGDTTLFQKTVKAQEQIEQLTDEEMKNIFENISSYSSPFS